MTADHKEAVRVWLAPLIAYKSRLSGRRGGDPGNDPAKISGKIQKNSPVLIDAEKVLV